MKNNLKMTPLQKIVGFDAAEEVYDLLPLTAQVILDLKIEGYTDSDIARALKMPRTTVVDTFNRAKYFLASSNLKLTLDIRAYYRETHSTVLEEN